MSSRFSLQKPYVVATLPQSIDQSQNSYVVGEVFGGAPGTKKRKRSELAVGIDGEGVNLYDISCSRLITSYALPPQSSFTCPPTSIRTRVTKTRVERRTYISTSGQIPRITLFLDATDGATPVESSTINHDMKNSSHPIVYIGTVTTPRIPDSSQHTSDLLAVKQDGEIHCYDGQSLEEKWISPAAALSRDLPLSVNSLTVEFAQLTNAFSASQGILKGRQDVFAMFPQEIIEDGFNPEILVITTKSDTGLRTLHIVSLPRRNPSNLGGLQHSIEPLLAADIPQYSYRSAKGPPSFSIQVSAGVLQQLHGGVLTTYDLTETLPKEQATLRVPGAQSFLRLSNTSVMVSTDESISVYNPKYLSKLATVGLNLPSGTDSLKRKRGAHEKVNGVQGHSCKFISYFPKLGTAIALMDNNLVGIQIESQQDRHGKPRATGLLIDSLGCSTEGQSRSGREGKRPKALETKTLDSILPSSISSDKLFADQIAPIEQLFANGPCNEADFDRMVAEYLGTKLSANGEISNGVDNSPKSEADSGANKSPFDVDRRWIIFALSKIFTVHQRDTGDSLAIQFYPPTTFNWLIENGFVTVRNIESALKKPSIPAGQLVDTVVELDPDMDLLLGLIAMNHLGASELLHAIRHLMESLGLLGDNPNSKQGLLTNGEELDEIEGDVEKQLEKLEAEAEKDLELAEHQLGPGSGIRGHALSLALSKLYTCPNDAIVYSLQTTFNSQEVVCLIYLLRFELAKGAWTTKYTDVDEMEFLDEDSGIQDNAIVLISSLINNCIDAVGAGGWLSGEARLADGDPYEAEEIITSLKLEVSAALEGLEEAVYLKGIISEIVRYGDAVEASLPTIDPERPKKRSDAPILLPSADLDPFTLPIGLKADKKIPLLKTGAGGALYKRTMRDVGHLKSQKVGKYSRERIII